MAGNSEGVHLRLARLCVTILGLSAYVEGNYGVGESCVDPESNLAGTCMLLNDCPSAKERIEEQYPELCGYVGVKPIVCCIQPMELRRRRAVGEVSRNKCKEYAKMVYYTKRRPTLDYGGNKQQVLAECRIVAKPLIIGGEKAKEAEFPHMAILGYKKDNGRVDWQCGGSLISENFVLTAAHCTQGENGAPSVVRIGVTNIHDDNYRQEYMVADIIPHPEYDPPFYYNDISLIKLHKHIRPNPLVRPACLDTSSHVKRRAVATGWGKTHNSGGRSEDLMKVTLELVGRDECEIYYFPDKKLPKGVDDSRQLCAGSVNKFMDTCVGDSGGPLQVSNFKHNETKCTYSIIGVTSFGKPCGIVKNPGIYTRIRPYIKWIEDTVWPEKH